jgi:hypothetical protein
MYFIERTKWYKASLIFASSRVAQTRALSSRNQMRKTEIREKLSNDIVHTACDSTAAAAYPQTRRASNNLNRRFWTSAEFDIGMARVA